MLASTRRISRLGVDRAHRRAEVAAQRIESAQAGCGLERTGRSASVNRDRARTLSRGIALCAALACGAGLAACQTTEGGAPGPAGSDPATSRFDAERAFDHLRELADIGPRVSGTRGAEEAREYLGEQLAKLGAEQVEYRVRLARDEAAPLTDAVELVHRVGVLPGDSSDVILLAAPYDTYPVETFRNVGANDGASGPALLLELGRVLAAAPRPYTIWLAFIDGDSFPLQGGGADPDALRPLVGSEWLAGELAESGSAARIRLAVVFNQVADPDLQIARDLRSHRPYREAFWKAARDLGHGDAFSESANFSTPEGAHRSFIEHDLRRVVAIIDDRHGGDLAPGFYWRTPDDRPDHCAPESLGVVGEVTLETLDRIAAQLAKIDHFVRSPLDDRPPARESARSGGASADASREAGSATP